MTRINIDDDMIERAASRLYNAKPSDNQVDTPWDFANLQTKKLWRLKAKDTLQAALDRRTGPKDRRVEWDDVNIRWCRRNCSVIGKMGGRSDDETPWQSLPRKSDRLKREAEERSKIDLDEAMAKAKRKHAEAMRHIAEMEMFAAMPNEIHVSDDMVSAGLRASGLCFSEAFRTYEAYRNAYRAMRLQEMKERGQ